ncbi:MAG TPA: hypothetical protein DCG37_03795 [Lachnospiraceae bacterium]|nr:hypothetical protein [Lachnospiraceae bacterium]
MEELTRAKKRALYILTECDRTEKQLYDKLRKSGYSEEVIAETMKYVRSFGYLNDRKYAVRYIQYYRERKSTTRLRYDLIQKGVPTDVIDFAFEEAGEWDERNQIREAAEKKLSKMNTEDPKTYGKVASFLARRGYRGEDITAVLRDFF